MVRLANHHEYHWECIVSKLLQLACGPNYLGRCDIQAQQQHKSRDQTTTFREALVNIHVKCTKLCKIINFQVVNRENYILQKFQGIQFVNTHELYCNRQQGQNTLIEQSLLIKCLHDQKHSETPLSKQLCASFKRVQISLGKAHSFIQKTLNNKKTLNRTYNTLSQNTFRVKIL